MKFTLEYPTERQGYSPDLLRPDNISTIAKSAEAAGFDGICFSEHPAPSRKWLGGGGHHTFDPIAALSYCAATTSRLKLITNLLVLPYRNPLLTAKAMSTVDILSDGRLIAVAGSGYLKSEFAALGIDFDQRNALFDEAAEVITKAWTGEPISYRGRHFEALDQQIRPAPVQPHAPLWIGGNSKLARRRVVRHGRGWSPILADGNQAKTVRTSAIETPDQLASAVRGLREQLADAGRDPHSVDVQVQAPREASAPGDDSHDHELDELDAAGVSWVLVRAPADSVETVLHAVARYGEQIITRRDRGGE